MECQLTCIHDGFAKWCSEAAELSHNDKLAVDYYFKLFDHYNTTDQSHDQLLSIVLGGPDRPSKKQNKKH